MSGTLHLLGTTAMKRLMSNRVPSSRLEGSLKAHHLDVRISRPVYRKVHRSFPKRSVVMVALEALQHRMGKLR